MTPSVADTAVVEIRDNGVQIPGATASATTTSANNTVTLAINATIKQGCCCDGADTITVVLVDGAGIVNNISLRIQKA